MHFGEAKAHLHSLHSSHRRRHSTPSPTIAGTVCLAGYRRGGGDRQRGGPVRRKRLAPRLTRSDSGGGPLPAAPPRPLPCSSSAGCPPAPQAPPLLLRAAVTGSHLPWHASPPRGRRAGARFRRCDLDSSLLHRREWGRLARRIPAPGLVSSASLLHRHERGRPARCIPAPGLVSSLLPATSFSRAQPALSHVRMPSRREAMQFCTPSLLHRQFASQDALSVGDGRERAQEPSARQKCLCLIC
jgi:hypothetical protein